MSQKPRLPSALALLECQPVSFDHVVLIMFPKTFSFPVQPGNHDHPPLVQRPCADFQFFCRTQCEIAPRAISHRFSTQPLLQLTHRNPTVTEFRFIP
jgi:hypothetical protein